MMDNSKQQNQSRFLIAAVLLLGILLMPSIKAKREEAFVKD